MLPEDIQRQKEKQYYALTYRKKRQYIMDKEHNDVLAFLKNPRKGWGQVKSRRKHVIGNIYEEAMLAYITLLYNHANAKDMVCDMAMTSLVDPFTT